MARFFDELPHTAIEEARASKKPLVAILPVGATESHGPHMPLNTDVIISEGMARRAADLLDADRMQAFVLPSLAYTPADYASGFSGTISIQPSTLHALLDDIAAALKRQGFVCLALANSHFDPANVGVLREAAKRIEATGLKVAFADATRRNVATQLTDEFKSGDCHGGQFETSIVLAERPELVDQKAMKKLPQVKAGLVDAIQNGKQASFKSLGMSQSYCGAPAGASAVEGEQSLRILAQALADTVLAKLK